MLCCWFVWLVVGCVLIFCSIFGRLVLVRCLVRRVCGYIVICFMLVCCLFLLVILLVCWFWFWFIIIWLVLRISNWWWWFLVVFLVCFVLLVWVDWFCVVWLMCGCVLLVMFLIWWFCWCFMFSWFLVFLLLLFWFIIWMVWWWWCLLIGFRLLLFCVCWWWLKLLCWWVWFISCMLVWVWFCLCCFFLFVWCILLVCWCGIWVGVIRLCVRNVLFEFWVVGVFGVGLLNWGDWLWVVFIMKNVLRRLNCCNWRLMVWLLVKICWFVSCNIIWWIVMCWCWRLFVVCWLFVSCFCNGLMCWVSRFVVKMVRCWRKCVFVNCWRKRCRFWKLMKMFVGFGMWLIWGVCLVFGVCNCVMCCWFVCWMIWKVVRWCVSRLWSCLMSCVGILSVLLIWFGVFLFVCWRRWVVILVGLSWGRLFLNLRSVCCVVCLGCWNICWKVVMVCMWWNCWGVKVVSCLILMWFVCRLLCICKCRCCSGLWGSILVCWWEMFVSRVLFLRVWMGCWCNSFWCWCFFFFFED